MAPKGTNSKKESGRAKKAENESKKREEAATEKERKEAENWTEGAKSNNKSKEKEDKRKAELARKAESARLLAEEEASIPSKPKPNPKAGSKKNSASKASGDIAPTGGSSKGPSSGEVESYAASGLDDALDLLEVVNAKTDNASKGQQASGLERHPERRFKAAFELYQERELPNIKNDHPGLRLQQYKDLLYKQFQKSPDNPFNQAVVSYDATKEDKLAALETRNKGIEERLRERTKALSLEDN